MRSIISAVCLFVVSASVNADEITGTVTKNPGKNTYHVQTKFGGYTVTPGSAQVDAILNKFLGGVVRVNGAGKPVNFIASAAVGVSFPPVSAWMPRR